MSQKTDHFDAVVIGGGPHGLTYAHWLTEQRPGTRVAVVEKNESPGFKIGESTLASAKRSMIATGLSMPVLRRLFGNKTGIRFWWTDENRAELRRHLDVVDIEETFQVERRVLEIAMQEIASRRNGVELLKGTKVDLRNSSLESELKRIRCSTSDGGEFDIETRMLCDASGPAASLAKHKNLVKKQPEKSNTFTTNSYYAYFKKVGETDVDFWDEPATRHVCFPGGWTWFISLTSWEKTPDKNLRDMIRYLLSIPEGPDESYPSRQELCDQFGCQTEQVTSVGFVIRSDQDEMVHAKSRKAFEHYVSKHPAIENLLSAYELIEQPYERRPAYGSFRDLVYNASQTAGDGWAIVGDAAGFVNPLFSPGLNLGSGSAYLAAQLTAEGLNKGDLGRSQFRKYEDYVSKIYNALLTETDLYYRSFEHVDSFEWGIMMKLVFGAADVLPRNDKYSDRDLYPHDLLNPRFRTKVDEVRELMRVGTDKGTDPKKIAKDVKLVLRPFLAEVLQEDRVRKLRLGHVFSNYNDRGIRVNKKRRGRKGFGARRCEECSLWHDRSLNKCPVCGTKSESLNATIKQ